MMQAIKKNLLRGTIAMAGVCLMLTNANAQFEPQFTQYMFNEMFINPAYAGSRDFISLTADYRNQWVGIDGAPETQTISGHAPLANKKIGVGLSLLNEKIGVTHDMAAFANYAYRLQVTNDAVLAMGLQGGIINHQQKLLEIHTQDQGDASFSSNTPNLILPNMGFGFYYSTRKYYAGLSVPRMLENKVDVMANDMVSNNMNFSYWHYYLMGGYVYDLSEDMKLKPTFMLKAVSGAPLEADLGIHMLLKETLWFGASYRTKDSWAAIMQFQINKQLRLGYSYDYTTTELKQFNTGTHEITIGYDFSFDKNKIITPRYF
jgi:type IX secretion system PorP/SprF family membrane protein